MCFPVALVTEAMVTDLVTTGHHGFGYGSGYYGGGGLNVYENKEVPLILDFVGPESNIVIWRGLYKDEIDESGNMIMTEDKINEAVKKILEQFSPEKVAITN